MAAIFSESRIMDGLFSQDSRDGRGTRRDGLRQLGSLKFLQFVLVLSYLSTTTYALPKVTTSQTKSGTTCATPGLTGENLQDLLQKAMEEEDQEGVEEAAACGADLDRTTGDYTPLTWTVAHGKCEVLKALLRLGADPEKKSASWEGTPLHWAAARGQEVCVAYLLEGGACVRAVDGTRRTALHHAAFQDHLGIAKLLVCAGAEVNARNGQDQTPLTMALLGAEEPMETYLRSVGGEE